MTRPLTAVLDAFEAGATSLADVEDSTRLGRDVVSAAVEHLVRAGRLEARSLSAGCPAGGCGGCAFASADGTAGCPTGAPTPGRRGPGLVALTLRRRPDPA